MKQKTDLEKKHSETMNEIDMIINSIQRKLKKHNKLFHNDPTNWGYLGNLGAVRNDLTNIDEFLGKL